MRKTPRLAEFRVEKREIEPRPRPVRVTGQKPIVEKPLGPIAREVAGAFKARPGRFPRAWFKD